MKIGIICYPSVGGSGVIATILGQRLAERGHEVHFITYEIPFLLRTDEDNIFFHEVEINQYELFKYPDYALALAVKMAEVSKCYHLDILHVHYAIPHATSAYLAKQMLGTDLPHIITTLHGTDITLVGKDPNYFDIVKFSIEKSCGVTAVSNGLACQTHKSFNTKKDIEVIYNFFSPRKELIGTKPLARLFAPNQEKLLIHSSNYRQVKHPNDVIAIFQKIRSQIPAKLLLLGSGPGLEIIREIVNEHNLQQDVFFLGQTRVVDRYLCSSDLFLMPSEQESFGLAALEAMAYGIPVVASDVGGLPELVLEGKTGYLCPVGDVDQMAARALDLLTNPSLYATMSSGSIKIAEEKFGTEKIITQYEAYYEKILRGC